MTITVDNVAYNVHIVSLKRSFAVLDGEAAGRTEDATMHRDVKGTFYNYTLGIEPLPSNRADYDALYEVLSAPTASHSITLPYAQNTMTYTAYVTQGSDSLRIISDGKHVYEGLTIEFIAMSPQRRPT